MAKIQSQPNNISSIREQKGLTIEQLAERSGLSVGYISRMARGERNISLKNLAKLADALGVSPSELIEDQPPSEIPIVTWVSAGMMVRNDGQQDEVIGGIQMPDLDPKGHWIALEVAGDSMDRISPPGSLIFVNLLDRELVPNACYIIANEENEVTYKRFRSNPSRFEPVSTNSLHETIYPDEEPTIIGRVRRSIINM
jgi:transcriptional regulator with XRE-family HTH domain